MDSNLLNDRISRLKEWEQTESLNEILFSALSSLNNYARDRFDQLTREVRDESTLNGPPEIKVAVCTEEDIDKQIFLHPVATQPPIDSPGYITTVFAKCDYPTIQEIIGQTFAARIQGESGTFHTQVELKYSIKYLQKMESLYYAFNENELPWSTINGPYFFKFLDVFCKQGTEQEISGFEIDFGPYKKHLTYDKALLWNITALTVPVAACEAKPAYNAVQYEHMLKNVPLDGDQYLVCSPGDKFSSFRRGRDIFVRTYAKQLEHVRLLRIISSEGADCPLFLPLKSNRKRPGFIDSMAARCNIPTCGEAERIVSSLGEAAQLQLMGIEKIPRAEENVARYRGLDYNSFREENMVTKDKELLLFTFSSSAERMWAHETMYYALSELQLHFYEHRCVAEMI